jgi:YD repeat-containing protein
MNTPVVDAWGNQSDTFAANYSKPITFTTGQLTVPIKVEYYQAIGTSFMSLVFTGPNNPKDTSIPASWLTHDTAGLPQGWTLAPAGVSYASARIGDRSLVLTDPSGSTQAYPWSGAGPGFVPPASGDGVAGLDTSGSLTVEADDGRTYVFDAYGSIVSASAAGNDGGQSTALQFRWSTDTGPHRLSSIYDPVSGRSGALTYGNTAPTDPCPTATTGPGFTRAPANMLCRVAWPDGSETDLFYVSVGTNLPPQLGRIADPGGATTDFAYDSSGRVSKVRTPLQADAVAQTAVTHVPDDDTSRSEVAYDGSGRVASVTLAGATGSQPAHSYVYGVSGATVHTAGLSEPAGFTADYSWEPDPNQWSASGGVFARPRARRRRARSRPPTPSSPTRRRPPSTTGATACWPPPAPTPAPPGPPTPPPPAST